MFLNIFIGFLSSFLVLLSSFYSYYRFVKDTELKVNSDDRFTNIKNTVISSPAFLSPLRLISYLFLVVSFLYLNRNGYLEIPYFLIGISLSLLLFLSAIIYIKVKNG